MSSAPTPTLLDRVISWVSPSAGLRRHFDRLRLTRAYEAASPRDPWKPRRAGASADTDHFADASALRAKSRALRANVPYIRAGLEARAAAAIGTGIVPKFRGASGRRLQALWKAWAPYADADGLRDVYGLQAAAFRAMDVDGEVLIRIRTRRAEDGLPVPIQFQLLEIDWLDTTRLRAEPSGNETRNGIEYDALGRRVAYWVWDQHPGDVTTQRRARTQSRRIDARQIIHLFSPERPNQGRGFPRLAPVITRVRDLQLYEDAELARKNLETRLSVLASGDLSNLANPITPDVAADPAAARATGNLGELSSGSIIEMPPGVNMTVVEPKPSTGYAEYVKHQLHLICAGGGFTYESATGDMREVNFSSARVRMLDFRREIEQLQWHVVVPMLCQRIVDAFAETALLGGAINRLAYTVEHSTPRWEYVNPEQDVRAELAAISGGLTSISEVIRRRGYDPDEVFAEWSADIKRVNDAGLTDIMLAMMKARPASAGASE
jgi:lambda family phage portal protein